MNTGTYYYDLLDRTRRSVYHDIRKGLLEQAESFATLKIPFRELSEIYFLVRLDDPMIFYTNGFSIGYYEHAESVILKPKYIYRKKEIAEKKKQLESRIEKIVRPAKDMTADEKEKYIHDFILDNVTYDKLKKAYSHEITGTLFHGIGVCEGIAKTVKILSDRLGLKCIIALSENNPEKGIKYRHTWNVLDTGKGCVHLDVTFDNSLSRDGIKRYDYFNISDKDLYRDHEPSIYPLPACPSSDRSWYRTSKLVLTKTEDVKKRILQNAKKNRTFIFQWKGSYLTREVLNDFWKMISEAAEEQGKCARISLNWPQAVMQVSFTEEKPEENDFLMEEANEGENYDEPSEDVPSAEEK